MENKEYLESIKDDDENYRTNSDGHEYRKVKALEIIAEELIKFNLTANVLTSVVEGVTNQGNQVNVNARVI